MRMDADGFVERFQVVAEDDLSMGKERREKELVNKKYLATSRK